MPDVNLLSLAGSVDPVGGVVSHARGRWRDLIGACARGAHHWLVRLARPPRADLSGKRKKDLLMDGEHGPFDMPIVGIVDDCGDARGQSIADLGNSEDDDSLNHRGIGHA